MEEIANTLVEGYKRAKAAIEDLAENLVDGENLYDKACAALKRQDYTGFDDIISMISDESVILHLLHKCCQLADIEAVSVMCQPPPCSVREQIEWSPSEVSRRRDIICGLHNRQEVVETAIDSLIRYKTIGDGQIHRGHPEACLQVLIDAGFDVGHEDEFSLLQLCIRHQNVPALKLLLQHGCDPGHVTGGTSLLMHVIEADAVARNKAEALELLSVEPAGCSSSYYCMLGSVSDDGSISSGGGGVGGAFAQSLQSALCYHHRRGSYTENSPSSRSGQVEVARGFHIISPGEQISVFAEMFHVLIRAGGDVNMATAHGSVLHCAVETLGFGECAAPYYLQLPSYILSCPNLDPNCVDEEGRTALHLALMYKRFEAARQILMLPNCDVNVEDALGFTPLHLISWNNNPSAPEQAVSIMHHLIHLGADLNASLSPFSPLNIALEGCLFTHAALLLRHGLDASTNDLTEWDCFLSATGNHGVVIPNPHDELKDHVKYILKSGLNVNVYTLSVMIKQTLLTALLTKCYEHPSSHLHVDAVRNWCMMGNTQETPIKVWYLSNLQDFVDTLTFVSLFDRCRITVRQSIGGVHLHRKIDSLTNLPDKIKTWLKLDAI